MATTIEVITTVQAVVSERWVLKVSDVDAELAMAAPACALALLEDGVATRLVSVEDTGTSDEHDRRVESVEVVGAR